MKRAGGLDAVVIGAGPNGLAAAVALASAGLSVRVLEAADQPGGGCRTSERTLPGFRHDVCSSVHPLGLASPWFRALELDDELTWVQSPAAVAHVLGDGRVVTLEKGHQINVRTGPALTIQADGDQLEQLLINLIRNALDAVRETGGAVTVGWDRVTASSPMSMELWVEDEGPGLSNTGNLFVPFFTTKPGGSGIGLVLSRQIAEAHGGSLMLANRDDRRGCRATLRMPLQVLNG